MPLARTIRLRSDALSSFRAPGSFGNQDSVIGRMPSDAEGRNRHQLVSLRKGNLVTEAMAWAVAEELCENMIDLPHHTAEYIQDCESAGDVFDLIFEQPSSSDMSGLNSRRKVGKWKWSRERRYGEPLAHRTVSVLGEAVSFLRGVLGSTLDPGSPLSLIDPRNDEEHIEVVKHLAIEIAYQDRLTKSESNQSPSISDAEKLAREKYGVALDDIYRVCRIITAVNPETIRYAVIDGERAGLSIAIPLTKEAATAMQRGRLGPFDIEEKHIATRSRFILLFGLADVRPIQSKSLKLITMRTDILISFCLQGAKLFDPSDHGPLHAFSFEISSCELNKLRLQSVGFVPIDPMNRKFSDNIVYTMVHMNPRARKRSDRLAAKFLGAIITSMQSELDEPEVLRD